MRRRREKEQYRLHWLFHQEYGLLPSSFVDLSLFSKLFQSPKEYESRLVKDYESFVEVARTLEEVPEYSEIEVNTIVNQILQNAFSGRKVSKLTNDEKGRLATLMTKKYAMTESLVAKALNISEHMVRQFLRAKDYGNNKCLLL